jgi:signal transduction histidine kinase
MPELTQTTQIQADAENPPIPFSRVTALVRQLTHDARNGLNNIDLQAAFLQEIAADPKVVPEIKRLRGMVTEAARMLQGFSAMFWLANPHVVTYSAAIFIEDFQSRLVKALPEQAAAAHWTVKLGKEQISIDLEMFFRALLELFKNAFQFREGERPIEASVGPEGDRLMIRLVESKAAVPSPPETWGLEPLVSTRRNGFGMGLFHARRIFALHHAEMEASFDSVEERLVTRVSLPLTAR